MSKTASILSVGIDIGTSTTQVIFSRIDIDNTAGYFSAPRIAIIGKELLYKSSIYFTPLLSNDLIDAAAVRSIVSREYAQAGYAPEDVSTGAVIITGESARKENAALVLQELSGFAGEFVVSTAGPDLEAVVAAKGSGAFEKSLRDECTVINLDIGGGTTNIAVFDSGVEKGKTCYDIGGRLIRLDKNRRISYISPAAEKIARAQGIALQTGEQANEAVLMGIAEKMASLLAEAAGLLPSSPLLDSLRTVNSSRLVPPKGKAYICFSGGVGECFRKDMAGDPFCYGDIGVLLGRAMRKHPAIQSARIAETAETIRATVVGAGTYTTSLSGSTISYSPGVFPVKNLPVLRLSREEQARCVKGDAAFLAEKMLWFLKQSDSDKMLVSLCGLRDPSYEDVQSLAACFIRAADRSLLPETPLFTAVEEDMAKALGNGMKAMTDRRIAVIDSISAEAGDFVDIGRPMMDGLVVPVIVKTLLFG